MHSNQKFGGIAIFIIILLILYSVATIVSNIDEKYNITGVNVELFSIDHMDSTNLYLNKFTYKPYDTIVILLKFNFDYYSERYEEPLLEDTNFPDGIKGTDDPIRSVDLSITNGKNNSTEFMVKSKFIECIYFDDNRRIGGHLIESRQESPKTCYLAQFYDSTDDIVNNQHNLSIHKMAGYHALLIKVKDESEVNFKITTIKGYYFNKKITLK